MNLYEMFEQPQELTLVDALGDFLPIAVKHLNINKLPRFTFDSNTHAGPQASFGSYDSETNTIRLAIINRQPVDILRTLAHELVHTSQRDHNELGVNSWRTGSPEENEANAAAGIIMRKFAKLHPEYLTLPAVTVPDQLDEKRRRKSKRNSKKSPVSYYGYYWGGVNTGTEHSDAGSGDSGESMYESIGKTALVGVLAAALSMVSSPARAEPSDAAKALGIYRTINRYKDYNSASLEGEAQQELNNILRAIQGHPNQSKLLPIIKKMIKSDAPQEEELPPLTNPEDNMQENFSDGKKPGRKGLAKRSGVDCSKSVTALRKIAKNSSGEKQRMAHWCANMKSGRNK